MDDIDWDQSPRATFKSSTGETVTLLDYYQKVSLAIPMFVSLSQTFVRLFLEHVIQWQSKQGIRHIFLLCVSTQTLPWLGTLHKSLLDMAACSTGLQKGREGVGGVSCARKLCTFKLYRSLVSRAFNCGLFITCGLTKSTLCPVYDLPKRKCEKYRCACKKKRCTTCEFCIRRFFLS